MDNMDKQQMQNVFDKVCKAWNEHDFNECHKESCNTNFRQCKHKFTKYDTLGDNTRSYYCAYCGLCK